MNPVRKSANTSFDAHARAAGAANQGKDSYAREDSTPSQASKSAYTRKTALTDPTSVAWSRTAEGSVLPGVSSQPDAHKTSQKLSKLSKGVD